MSNGMIRTLELLMLQFGDAVLGAITVQGALTKVTSACYRVVLIAIDLYGP